MVKVGRYANVDELARKKFTIVPGETIYYAALLGKALFQLVDYICDSAFL
jgi:hypothetical protein